MGNTESVSSFFEHIPVIGYIPAIIYAAEGDSAKAKRAAARATHATTQFAAVTVALALAPETGGASLIAAGALAGGVGEAAGLGAQVAIETSYTEDELKELGGRKEVTDMSAEGWVSDIVIGAASGAAMGASRFVTNPLKEVAEEEAITTVEALEEEATRVATVEEEAAGEGTTLIRRVNNWVQPHPSVPPPQGAMSKILRGTKWFFTKAPVFGSPYRIVFTKAARAEFALNAVLLSYVSVLEQMVEKHWVPEAKLSEELKSRTAAKGHDGKFVLYANSTVDKDGLTVLKAGMHLATRADSEMPVMADMRDSQSTFAYMTTSLSEHAVLRLEDAPSGKGLIIRVSKESGDTDKDRFLAIGDSDKYKYRDTESHYVYAHDNKDNAAVWEISLFQKKHLVFRLVDAGTSGGKAFITEFQSEVDEGTGLYLTALDQYDSDKRPGGGVYLSVVKRPVPIGFGILVAHHDDYWWMDLQGRYEDLSTPNDPDIMIIQQALHFDGLNMFMEGERCHSIQPQEHTEKELILRNGGEPVGKLLPNIENGRITGVTVEKKVGDSSRVTSVFRRQWWWDLIGLYENHRYDGFGKNDWHYVTIEEVDGKLMWSNRANKKWELIPGDYGKLKTGEGREYQDRREVSVDFDELGDIKALNFYTEPYEKVFWHEFTGKYIYTKLSSDPKVPDKSTILNIVMGNEQKKLIMTFSSGEEMQFLYPRDAESFSLSTLTDVASGGLNSSKIVKANRYDMKFGSKATLVLPDGRKFVRDG